jgi:hypothetical protein
MLLSLKNAEAYVAKTTNARWEGWTIVIHRPRASAEFKPYGRYDRQSNTWGTEVRIEANRKGMYSIPRR